MIILTVRKTGILQPPFIPQGRSFYSSQYHGFFHTCNSEHQILDGSTSFDPSMSHHASRLYSWLGGMTNLFIDTPRWVSVLRSRHINNLVAFFVALGSYEYSSWGYRVEFLAGNWALTARRRWCGNTLAASCCLAAAVDTTRKFEAFFCDVTVMSSAWPLAPSC